MGISFTYEGCNDSVDWQAGSIGPAILRIVIAAGYEGVSREDLFKYNFASELAEMERTNDPLRFFVGWYYANPYEEFTPDICIALATRLEQLIEAFTHKVILTTRASWEVYEEAVAYTRFKQMVELFRKAAALNLSVSGF